MLSCCRKRLTNALHVHCCPCRIKDTGLSSLCASLHGLDTLNLSGNIKFAPATLQQLQSLTSLTSLQASTAGLCNQGLAALAHSLQGAPLRVLDAAGNKISKVDAVTALTGLTSLTLSRNPLQVASTKVRQALRQPRYEALQSSRTATADRVAGSFSAAKSVVVAGLRSL
jgi:hypothetical protein